jgi:hypothetical protein
MVFFFNLIVSIIYFFLLERWISGSKISNTAYIWASSPILFLWLFICGGQYDVGTDYFSYLSVFNGEGQELFIQKGEYLFYAFVVSCNYLGFSGQTLFFVFYGIGFLFLTLFVKRIQMGREGGVLSSVLYYILLLRISLIIN